MCCHESSRLKTVVAVGRIELVLSCLLFLLGGSISLLLDSILHLGPGLLEILRLLEDTIGFRDGFGLGILLFRAGRSLLGERVESLGSLGGAVAVQQHLGTAGLLGAH